MLEAALNTLLLATSNPHKVDEVAASLGPLGWKIYTLEDVADGRPLPEEPVEDAPDFEGNAAIKARAYAAWSGIPTLADDSGLVVDALGGAPGVHSARWSGVDADRATRDAANNKKLVQALQSTIMSLIQLPYPLNGNLRLAKGSQSNIQCLVFYIK